jgi:hypothetical protein
VTRLGRPRRVGVGLVAISVLVAGCGLTSLQTARTVPWGETQTTVALSYLRNDQPVFLIPYLPIDFMVRHGVTDQVDLGARVFLGLGILGDVKWNLLPSNRRTALAVSIGAGGVVGPGGSDQSSEIVHVPIGATVSHAVTSWFTPYASVGYGAYWIFNYTDRDPTKTYVPHTGTGDGLLMAHLGIELSRASGRALLLEYTYARPVVDDPGDQFSFTTNHFFSIGFHTGDGSPAFSR